MITRFADVCPASGRIAPQAALEERDTNNGQRDNHVRSADFFSVEEYPTMSYSSTGLRRDGEALVMDGELTLKGVTRPLPLRIEPNGFGPDAFGGMVAGFSATGQPQDMRTR